MYSTLQAKNKCTLLNLNPKNPKKEALCCCQKNHMTSAEVVVGRNTTDSYRPPAVTNTHVTKHAYLQPLTPSRVPLRYANTALNLQR